MRIPGTRCRIRGWVSPWVIGLLPWGPPLLTGAYLGTVGYTVCAGGDYVDWYRTGDEGLLNFVPGVRSVVHGALK